MKLSLNWLKQYVDHGLTAEELSYRMTMAGLEVEGVQSFGNDTVFEIEVTPNRPDCLSILGLAREVSAITDKELKIPSFKNHSDAGSVDISIEYTAGCGRYIGTLLDGVAVKAFSMEKALLLQALGLNTISNIVDITNFVLFEMGQPLHAFDADKLVGGKIIVRRAKKGEKIVTLDDVERTLDESILVIADAQKPVAITGIMGGCDTAVTSSTRRILLESAYFDMGLVRRASRQLGLGSDSSYRFERGVDFAGVEAASHRATDLMLDWAGGKVIGRRDQCAAQALRAASLRAANIIVANADIQKLLGTTIDLARAKKILERLGCSVALSQDSLEVSPPGNRHDIKIKEDVIEEIARVIGFDHLPMSLPRIGAVNIPVDHQHDGFNGRISRGFIAQGFNEVLTYAMVSRVALEKTGYAGPAAIRMQNPMSAEQELMRPTVLANMLLVAASNINHGQKDLKFFEVGKRYLVEGERWTLGVLITGRREGDWRKGKREVLDFFDLKGALEAVLSQERVTGLSFAPGEGAAFDVGQVAVVSVQGQAAGLMGKISDEVLSKFDIKKAAVYFAEIDLELVATQVSARAKFELLDEYPCVVRDISLAVKGVCFEDIRQACFSQGKELLRKVLLVEEYRGDKIEAGYKGLVLSLVYQAKDHTLTEDEIKPVHEAVVAHLIKSLGVIRR
ncbi:MAG: phenylalanine--tRNA ligase subunit beta [Candidatus Omnitrophota bacterium]